MKRRGIFDSTANKTLGSLVRDTSRELEPTTSLPADAEGTALSVSKRQRKSTKAPRSKRLLFCCKLLETVYLRASTLLPAPLIYWYNAQRYLADLGVSGPFVQYLVGRYVRLCGHVIDEQPFLGMGTFQAAWFLIHGDAFEYIVRLAKSMGTQKIPDHYVLPLLQGLVASLREVIQLHCRHLGFLIDLALAEHLLCEFSKFRFRTSKSRKFKFSCAMEYQRLLEAFLHDAGLAELPTPTSPVTTTAPPLHPFEVDGRCVNARALSEIVDFFEACLVSFLRRRLGWKGSTPTRAGAQAILCDPRFRDARRLEWCWQLDRGSLQNYICVVRPIRIRMKEGLPLTPEDWLNLVASATLCTCAPARRQLGWISRQTLASQDPSLFQQMMNMPLRWPYSRAVGFKIR